MKIKPKGYFYTKNGFIDDDNGIIKFQSDDCNVKTLTKKESKQLFLSMFVYYVSRDDRFFEEIFNSCGYKRG